MALQLSAETTELTASSLPRPPSFLVGRGGNELRVVPQISSPLQSQINQKKKREKKKRPLSKIELSLKEGSYYGHFRI